MKLLPSILFFLCIVLCSCSQLQQIENDVPPVQTNSFKQRLEEVGGSQFIQGNSVKLLVNGDSYYPEMLRDILAAEASIQLETFIMMRSHITDRFVEVLAKKAQAGVKVQVLLDAIGSRMLDDAAKKKMRRAGVKLQFYRPWLSNPLFLNNRTHRKFLIIDESVAYTGGAGFADAWNGNGMTKWNWRDNQYKIKGPIVAKMSEQFSINWNSRGGKITKAKEQVVTQGRLAVQSVVAEPYFGRDRIASSYLLAINAARKNIVMAMAYTCPPKKIERAIQRARDRGVSVRILSPGNTIDSKICRRCAHNKWKKWLTWGVEIYEYQPTMMHAKMVVVDDYLVMAGAANMDYRSFFLNDENNIHILDAGVAQQHLKQFEKDLLLSRKITQNKLKKFSLSAWLLQSQL